MGKIAQFFGLQEAATPETGELATARHQAERAIESMAQMQLAMEDMGWEKLTGQFAQEFTRDGLKRAAELSRMMAIANPLIKRGLAIRASYVHGQGVGITARADGNEGTQDVNAVVQDFLDDDTNRAALTGHQAKLRLETSIGTDGNIFIALFTNPLIGKVQARTLPFDEITDKVTLPGDRMVTMFYRRDWTENGSPHTAYYPDIRWRPLTRTKWYTDGQNRYEIKWDSPVYHLQDNGLDGWKFGIGDAYAALPWARAYKEFLEDWVLLIKALSRIAFQMSKSKTPLSQKSRAALQNMPAGSTVNTGEQKIEAVPKTGATIDSESGRPVATMAAAALGVPVTTLMADPGQTGARAVAETLNQPTMLEFKGRQELWTEALRAILGYVIDQAVIAPRGPLKGTVTREQNTLTVQLAGDTDRTIDFEWPDINEMPVETIMKALVDADGTGKMPPLVTLRLMLRALGVRDVDEILKDFEDENGNWIDPAANAGDQAAQDFRRGENKEAAR
jgi:hypothetical protein